MVLPTYCPVNFNLWPVLDPVDKEVQRDIVLLHIFGTPNNLSAIFVTTEDIVYALGSNDFGRLGIGEMSSADTPTPIENLCGQNIVSFASGTGHSLALNSSGTRIFCWGSNDLGPLGNGTNINRDIPGVVILPEGVTVSDIRAGGTYSLALTTEGKVLHWGDVLFTTCSAQKIPIPVQLPEYVRVESIECGVSHAAALTSDQQVYLWGMVNPNETWKEPRLVQTQGIIQIACSRFITIGLDQEGVVHWLDREDFTFNVGAPVTEISSTSNISSPIVFRTEENFISLTPGGETIRKLDIWGFFHNIQSSFPGEQTPLVKRRDTVCHACLSQLFADEEVLPDGVPRDISPLFNVKDYSDLTIKLKDGNVHVHKLILVFFCDHFKSMFLGSWAQNHKKDEIDMSNYNSKSYRAFLKFLYTGRIEKLNGEEIVDLYDIAQSYFETDLKRMAVEAFRKALKPSSVSYLFSLAHEHNFTELTDLCYEFSSNCLDEVILSEGFASLSGELTKTLVTEATKRKVKN